MIKEYVAINAKIKAMIAKMLHPDDIQNIIQKKSVSEIANYLQSETDYKRMFEDAGSVDKVGRTKLERMLYRYLSDDMARLIKFLVVYQDKFFGIYIKRYEINLLKSVIRMIYNRHKDSISPYFPDYFRKRMSISKTNFTSVNNLSELADALRKTEYYHLINGFITNRSDIYQMEMKLDDYYYELLWKSISETLEGKDREIATQIFGTKIDLTNIQWIIRWKSFYDTPKEIIYAYALNIHYNLKKSELISLVEAKNSQDCFEIISKTKYKDILTHRENVFIEHNCDMYIMKLHKKIAKQYPNSIASVIAYLFRLENEIQNLVRIAECVKYNTATSQLENYLIT